MDGPSKLIFQPGEVTGKSHIVKKQELMKLGVAFLINRPGADRALLQITL